MSVNKKEYSIMPGKKINKLLTTLKTIFQQKESPLPAISTTHRSPKEDRKSLSSSKGHSSNTSTIPRKSSSSSKEDRKPPSSFKGRGHGSSTSSHAKLSLKMYSLGAYAPNAQKSDVTKKKSTHVIPTTAATKKKTGK